MKEKTWHPKEGVRLREIGKQYMIVEASEENVNMSDVYSLNETAADLWKQLETGNSTATGLAEYLCKHYETHPATALHDVERQLAEWESFGLLLTR